MILNEIYFFIRNYNQGCLVEALNQQQRVIKQKKRQKVTLFPQYKYYSLQNLLQIMYKNQEAYPASPYEPASLCESLSKQLNDLSLLSRKSSQTQTLEGSGCLPFFEKGKSISKKQRKQCVVPKQQYTQISKKRQNTIKRLKHQQNRISELQREISSLRRKCQRCSFCRGEHPHQRMVLDDSQIIQQEELSRLGAQCIQRVSSRESVEFQAIDFSQSLAYKPEMDDRAWVMLGTMMIIIGSKNMEIDGTINNFKVISDCVDSVRRQVQKSTEKIALDFYFMKQEMKEMNIMQGISFDPFFTKNEKSGLSLQGVKVESVEQFQLVYDQKIKFSVNYDSLISTIEHLKQNCWIAI